MLFSDRLPAVTSMPAPVPLLPPLIVNPLIVTVLVAGGEAALGGEDAERAGRAGDGQVGRPRAVDRHRVR